MCEWTRTTTASRGQSEESPIEPETRQMPESEACKSLCNLPTKRFSDLRVAARDQRIWRDSCRIQPQRKLCRRFSPLETVAPLVLWSVNRIWFYTHRGWIMNQMIPNPVPIPEWTAKQRSLKPLAVRRWRRPEPALAVYRADYVTAEPWEIAGSHIFWIWDCFPPFFLFNHFGFLVPLGRNPFSFYYESPRSSSIS